MSELHKYVIAKEGGLEQPIIFPTTMNHSDIVVRRATIVSAGFVDFYAVEGCKLHFKTRGSSTTLGLRSRGEIDDDIFRRFYCE